MSAGVFNHVARDHPFLNKDLYYRFSADEDHGYAPDSDERETEGKWLELLPQVRGSDGVTDSDDDARVSSRSRNATSGRIGEGITHHGVSPLDAHNIALLKEVAPRGWVNPPEKKGKYNMIVIGAGAGCVSFYIPLSFVSNQHKAFLFAAALASNLSHT